MMKYSTYLLCAYTRARLAHTHPQCKEADKTMKKKTNYISRRIALMGPTFCVFGHVYYILATIFASNMKLKFTKAKRFEILPGFSFCLLVAVDGLRN